MQAVEVQTAGPGSPSPERTEARRADIQGLRAVAVALVVLFHADVVLKGGFVGVDVFFVISGFVITAMLLRETGRTDSLSLRTFYARRARRLLPALAVTLVAVLVVSAFLLSPLGPQQRVAKTGAATSLFASNLELFLNPDGYFDASANTNPLLHTWSLAVEEQFYLLFPMVLLVAWRLGRRWRGANPRVLFGLLLLVATVASFALASGLVGHSRRGAQLAFYASPARAWEFAVGALLAVAVPVVLRIRPSLGPPIGAVGLAAVLASAALIEGTRRFPPEVAVVPVLGTMLVILGGTLSTGGVSRLLSARPLVWLGDVSYSWYLWHWPMIVFGRALLPGRAWIGIVAGVAALGPTWLSMRYVENPLRFHRQLDGGKVLRLAAVCILGPLLVAGLLFASTGLIVGRSEALQAREAQSALHADARRGCSDQPAVPVPPKPSCLWKADGPAKGLVALVGDSNAGHFTEPIAEAATSLGFDFTVATAPGCPFVLLDMNLTTEKGPACERFVGRSLENLKRLRPALVVIGSSATGYISSGDGFRRPSAGGDLVRTRRGKAGLWEIGLRSVVTDLSAAGIETLVLHTVPHFDDYDLRQCPAFRLYADPQACAVSITRAEAETQRGYARRAVDGATTAVPGVRVADLTDDVCGPRVCSTTVGDHFVYRDRTHLSIKAARALTGRFRQLLAPALPASEPEGQP